MNAAPVSQALIEHDDTPPKREMVIAAAPEPMTPMQMAYALIQNGADLGSVKEMLAMSKELAADQSRRAFDAAVAEAKAEIPTVRKNAKGHNDKQYANFAAYASVIDPIISKFGLSYRFRTTQTDRINVTCVLAHKEGHYEETTLSGPADTTGSKNAIQAIGSTLTYLQRYTLVQALGLAASEDDDGRAAGANDDGTLISQEQATTLRKLIEDNGRDVVKFCAYFKIDAIPDLPASQFARAVTALSKKAA
jgi:hypothetical protein